MNMFARFDENPAMTLQDIKETKVTDGCTHAQTDVKTVYPPQSLRGGGGVIISKKISLSHILDCLQYIDCHHMVYHFFFQMEQSI